MTLKEVWNKNNKQTEDNDDRIPASKINFIWMP